MVQVLHQYFITLDLHRPLSRMQRLCRLTECFVNHLVNPVYQHVFGDRR